MNVLRSVLAAAFVLLWCGVPKPVSADTSAYSSLALEEDCRLVEPSGSEEAQGAEWWCEGFRNTDVWVAEGDLRFFLGYGRNAKQQCSARQTLSAFNTIGKTLEWRVIRETQGHMRPIATILRYRTESDGRKGQYLVVTKLGPGEACHMAYVDVKTSRDANVLARRAADEFAEDFDCRRDQPFLMTWAGPSEEDLPASGGCPRD